MLLLTARLLLLLALLLLCCLLLALLTPRPLLLCSLSLLLLLLLLLQLLSLLLIRLRLLRLLSTCLLLLLAKLRLLLLRLLCLLYLLLLLSQLRLLALLLRLRRLLLLNARLLSLCLLRLLNLHLLLRPLLRLLILLGLLHLLLLRERLRLLSPLHLQLLRPASVTATCELGARNIGRLVVDHGWSIETTNALRSTGRAALRSIATAVGVRAAPVHAPRIPAPAVAFQRRADHHAQAESHRARRSDLPVRIAGITLLDNHRRRIGITRVSRNRFAVDDFGVVARYVDHVRLRRLDGDVLRGRLDDRRAGVVHRRIRVRCVVGGSRCGRHPQLGGALQLAGTRCTLTHDLDRVHHVVRVVVVGLPESGGPWQILRHLVQHALERRERFDARVPRLPLCGIGQRAGLQSTVLRNPGIGRGDLIGVGRTGQHLRDELVGIQRDGRDHLIQLLGARRHVGRCSGRQGRGNRLGHDGRRFGCRCGRDHRRSSRRGCCVGLVATGQHQRRYAKRDEGPLGAVGACLEDGGAMSHGNAF